MISTRSGGIPTSSSASRNAAAVASASAASMRPPGNADLSRMRVQMRRAKRQQHLDTILPLDQRHQNGGGPQGTGRTKLRVEVVVSAQGELVGSARDETATRPRLPAERRLDRHPRQWRSLAAVSGKNARRSIPPNSCISAVFGTASATSS